MELKVIARVKSDFSAKFGVPRQSGLVCGLYSEIVFEKEYAVESAVRELDGYSHIWLIWGFDRVCREGWTPTVRPPRLGGNRRVGVFASRSPFRPNPLGLSCVRLCKIDTIQGVKLTVEGADLTNGTPIYDIKPYLGFTDSVPEAVCGFASEHFAESLKVCLPEQLARKIPPDKVQVICDILAQDPRPSFHDDPQRVYGFAFAGLEIKFRVDGNELTVLDIT